MVIDDLPADHTDLALLSELPARSPALKLIVTASGPLGLTGEREFAVPSLAMPVLRDSESLGAIEREAAVALFVGRARAVQPGFSLNVANAVAVAEICRRLQGVPLAIEIAAARSRPIPPQPLLVRLSERPGSIAPPPLTGPDTSEMLASLIDWSVETLDAADQLIFGTLGVFSGSFNIAAAEDVACVTVEPPAMKLHLGVLVNAALVHCHVDDSGTARYHLPDPVLTQARRLVMESGAESDVRQRHADWYAAMANAAAEGFRTDRQYEWLGELQTEVHNLRAALEWLYSSLRTDDALRMATNLSRFWASRWGVSEGRVWLERGIADTSGVAPTTLAAARDAASWLVLLQRDVQSATDLIEENLKLYRSTGDGHGIATTLDGLGELALSNGAFLDAERYFSDSLAIWIDRAADWNVAMTSISLGCVALNLDDIPRASECYATGRSELTRLGDRRAAGVALLADAWLKLHRGVRADARTDFLTALRTFRELGVILETAEALEGLSAVAHAVGEDARAIELLAYALLLRRESGVLPSFISRLGYLAERRALRVELSTTGVDAVWQPGRADGEYCIEALMNDVSSNA